MNKTNIIKGNPLTMRYPPNNRFIYGAFKEQIEIPIRKDDFGESVVDKESYRLSMASRRGAVSSLGSSYVGQYMFDDGKYDPNKDYSFALRKDLSIVELDNYIKNLEAQQTEADETLKMQIESELAAAREQLETKKQNNKNNTSTGD